MKSTYHAELVHEASHLLRQPPEARRHATGQQPAQVLWVRYEEVLQLLLCAVTHMSVTRRGGTASFDVRLSDDGGRAGEVLTTSGVSQQGRKCSAQHSM